MCDRFHRHLCIRAHTNMHIIHYPCKEIHTQTYVFKQNLIHKHIRLSTLSNSLAQKHRNTHIYNDIYNDMLRRFLGVSLCIMLWPMLHVKVHNWTIYLSKLFNYSHYDLEKNLKYSNYVNFRNSKKGISKVFFKIRKQIVNDIFTGTNDLLWIILSYFASSFVWNLFAILFKFLVFNLEDYK